MTRSASGAAPPGGAIQAVPSPRLLAGRMSRSRLSPTKRIRESAGNAASALRKIASEGLIGRIVKVYHTSDCAAIGHVAARLSGSGIGIGLQSRGTTVVSGNQHGYVREFDAGLRRRPQI